MQGRLVAAALAERGTSAWDPAKLAAMQGRQRAEAIRLAGSDP
jgi:transposase